MSISVLLPSYKPEIYLERCLDSLECQTLPKRFFKVYLALNGPRDGYEDYVLTLLGKYSFQYDYTYLEAPGVSHARNILLEKSCEEYLTFVDDDDVLSSNYLEQLLLRASRDYISISNVFNFCDSLGVLSENYIGRSFSSLGDLEGSIFKARKFFSSPWAKLIHREIVGGVRFDVNLKVGEDSLFMARVSRRVKGVRKTEPTACYYVRTRIGSASRKKVVRAEELRRITYLVYSYGGMIFKGYNLPFILSRIAASLGHLKRLL